MENTNIFIEEETKLNEVKDTIEKEIEESLTNFNTEANTIIGYTEGLRGTQFTRQTKMSYYATKLNDLKSIVSSPYFGRFDFLDEERQLNQIYVGKKTVVDDRGKILVTDWRTPICSLYYDYGIGKASYENQGKTINGEIREKRQIIIKDGKLIDVKKQDVLSDDSFLISYLKDNNDARLKSIVATIQKDQNKIIRGPLRQNNIIQGVAGSGKTTVALHRLSYLLYNDVNNSNEFMILGPNNYFLDYISTMMPELDIKNVSQSTFETLAKESIKYKGKYKSKTDVLKEILDGKVSMQAIKDKNSIEFITLLENFMKKYITSHLQKPIMYEGVVLCDSKYLTEVVDSISFGINKTSGERLNQFIKILKKKVKEKGIDYASEYWSLNRERTLALPKNSDERKKELEHQEIISNEFKKGCPKKIVEYFNFLNVKPLDLYKVFIDSLQEEYNYIKEPTLKNLNSKTISDDDLAALMTITNCLKGISPNKNVTQLIIDEAQDISPAQYYIIKKMFPKAMFDIYGDMNQSIFFYQSFNNWDELNETIFNGKALRLDLSKTYRTTKQISDASNLILDKLNTSKAECISREGNEIRLNNCSTKDLTLNIIEEINDLRKMGNKSIAIVTKDEKEAQQLGKQLSKFGLELSIINDSDKKYNDGICIIPSYIIKGLEFDAIILADASNLKYSNNELDLKLLYVVITRAMHNLVINNTSKLNMALQPLDINVYQKKKIKKL